MKNYLLAAALANGDLRRFVDLVKGLKGPLLLLHFFLVSAMLYLPLMHALARLTPWEVFTRLDAASLVGMDRETFDQGMYQAGFSGRALFPLLCMVYFFLLVIQAVVYLLAAWFLGFSRWVSSYLSFRDRLGIFILSSTVPVAAAALFGFLLPTVHIIVFYLAEILLGFFISKKYDEPPRERAKLS
jgi:hypothetical protein